MDAYFFMLNDKGFFNTGPQHFQHLLIIEIIANVLEHFFIRHNTKGTKDNDNGNVLTNVG